MKTKIKKHPQIYEIFIDLRVLIAYYLFDVFYYLCQINFYLFTLAPAPPIMASTSDTVAIVVSPGVVIASAPWAVP